MKTKGEIVNVAYSMLRISGKTTIPSPDEIQDALWRLEQLAREWQGRNIVVNYNFEDVPLPSSYHNIPAEFWTAFQSNLAVNLAPDFGIEVTPALATRAAATLSSLSAASARNNMIQYPVRHPLGSGNQRRFTPIKRFFTPNPQPPLNYTVRTMFRGDIDDFTESFSQYLRPGEVITDFLFEAQDGLKVTNTAIASNLTDITYTLEAVGDTRYNLNHSYKMFITITTDQGRVSKREIGYYIKVADDFKVYPVE